MTTKAKLSKGNTLIYGNRKQDDMKWDISTPELRAKAFLELFNFLKQTWKVYTCGYWGESVEEQNEQRDLYQRAMNGDAAAAEKLLTMRIDYEYENWYVVDAPVAPEGEPKMVLARKPNKVYVKDIRKQRDNGNYSFELSNGEEIEMMYVPVNTTRRNWENGWLIQHFLTDSFYEKLGRDRDYEKHMEEVLSHMNYMRLTLYYTMFPEKMPLGKSLAKWQERSLSAAEGYIERFGSNPVEKLKDRKQRPTSLAKAQAALSELMLYHESALSLLKQLVTGKYDAETVKEHDLPRMREKVEEFKKGVVKEEL